MGYPMMSRFLYIELDTQDSFYVKSSCRILGKDYKKLKFKIDTGCAVSVIPYYRLSRDIQEAGELKIHDIDSGVDYRESYGVESGGYTHGIAASREEKITSPALKFKHLVTNITFGNYQIPDSYMHINYDRRGNILIGMDILKRFDFHCGESHVTGKYILLGCLKDRITPEYLMALEEHFGYSPDERK